MTAGYLPRQYFQVNVPTLFEMTTSTLKYNSACFVPTVAQFLGNINRGQVRQRCNSQLFVGGKRNK